MLFEEVIGAVTQWLLGHRTKSATESALNWLNVVSHDHAVRLRSLFPGLVHEPRDLITSAELQYREIEPE